MQCNKNNLNPRIKTEPVTVGSVLGMAQVGMRLDIFKKNKGEHCYIESDKIVDLKTYP